MKSSWEIMKPSVGVMAVGKLVMVSFEIILGTSMDKS